MATLRAEITWEEHKVRLDGYLPETTQSHMRRRAPMGYNVEPGTVFLGFHLIQGRKVGETVDVMGKPFRIARLLAEQGSRQDSTITMHLSDAQALLEKDDPPVINQILALECPLCRGGSADNPQAIGRSTAPNARRARYVEGRRPSEPAGRWSPRSTRGSLPNRGRTCASVRPDLSATGGPSGKNAREHGNAVRT